MNTNQKYPFLSIVTLVVWCMFTLSTAQAQGMGGMSDKTDEEKAQMLTDKQNETLSFYGSQATEMYDVNLKYLQEMQKIMAGGRSFATMRKLQNMGGQKDKEVKSILDKSQFKEYKKLKEEMREQMRAMMGNQR